MSKRVWNKGNPPHVGWWNASIENNAHVWRWWNGKKWSLAAYKEDSAKVAAWVATQKVTSERIEWTAYWPKNARVSRIDPRKASK